LAAVAAVGKAICFLIFFLGLGARRDGRLFFVGFHKLLLVEVGQVDILGLQVFHLVIQVHNDIFDVTSSGIFFKVIINELMGRKMLLQGRSIISWPALKLSVTHDCNAGYIIMMQDIGVLRR
jgi:hypothetical protein